VVVGALINSWDLKTARLRYSRAALVRLDFGYRVELPVQLRELGFSFSISV